MKKHIRWLVSELDRWVEEGLIDRDQRTAIAARYPDPGDGLPWGIIIFSCIGAVLVGMGVILFFAFNWDKMPKFAKLGVIYGSMLAAHGSAMWLRRKEGTSKGIGEALHLLGTALFGAGIWLTAQIYHIDEHYPNALLAWGLGALALAWALPSIPHGLAASICLLFWNGTEVFDFQQAAHLGPLLQLAGVGTLAAWLRSRILTATCVCAFMLSLAFSGGIASSSLIAPVVFCCGSTLIAMSIMVRKWNWFPESGPILAFFGNISYLGILYFLSFPDFADLGLRSVLENAVPMRYFFGCAVIAVGSWVAAFWPGGDEPEAQPGLIKVYDIAAVVTLVFLLFHWIMPHVFVRYAGTLLYNIVFLLSCILIIIRGCRTLNIKSTVAGCLLFALITVTRFVDLFDSLILRSVAFLIVGTAVFLVGVFYSRMKKQLMEQLT